MPIPFKPCKLQGLFGGHGLADPWAYWGYLSLWVLAVPPCNLDWCNACGLLSWDHARASAAGGPSLTKDVGCHLTEGMSAQTRIQGMCTYSSSRIDGYQVHKQEDGYPSFTFY